MQLGILTPPTTRHSGWHKETIITHSKVANHPTSHITIQAQSKSDRNQVRAKVFGQMPDKQRTSPINANSNGPAIYPKCFENRMPRATPTHTGFCMWIQDGKKDWNKEEGRAGQGEGRTKLLINFLVTAGHRHSTHRMPLTFQSKAKPIQFPLGSQSPRRCAGLMNLPNGVRQVFIYTQIHISIWLGKGKFS